MSKISMSPVSYLPVGKYTAPEGNGKIAHCQSYLIGTLAKSLAYHRKEIPYRH